MEKIIRDKQRLKCFMLERDWVREISAVSLMSGVRVQIRVYQGKIKNEGVEKRCTDDMF